MVDAVEIINRFTEFSPWKGEEPLPLPIPGHWFRKICALADRIAAAENERDLLRSELNSEIETATALGGYLDQAKAENKKLRSLVRFVLYGDEQNDLPTVEMILAYIRNNNISAEQE